MQFKFSCNLRHIEGKRYFFSFQPGAGSQKPEAGKNLNNISICSLYRTGGIKFMQAETFKARTFRDLKVWRKAHEYVLEIYRFTSAFPKNETFGLTQQMRRAAVSIPANIAEGFTRRGKNDKLRFLNFAESSLEESRYYLILAQELAYGQTEFLMSLSEEVSRPLNAYVRAILASKS
jgi:four helix bundle protein